MTRYSIANLPEKPLTDPRGRPIVDQARRPLTESMMTYLLGLSGDVSFVKGLNYVDSCDTAARFVAGVRAQEKDRFISLPEKFYQRIIGVLNNPTARFESQTLHCYAELNAAIMGAEKVSAEPTEALPAAAE